MYAMRQRGHIVSHVTVDIIMISDDWLSVYGTGDRPQGAAHSCVNLGNVDKGVDVGLVPLHVLVLDQPLDLLLHTIQTHIYRCSLFETDPVFFNMNCVHGIYLKLVGSEKK